MLTIRTFRVRFDTLEWVLGFKIYQRHSYYKLVPCIYVTLLVTQLFKDSIFSEKESLMVSLFVCKALNR